MEMELEVKEKNYILESIPYYKFKGHSNVTIDIRPGMMTLNGKEVIGIINSNLAYRSGNQMDRTYLRVYGLNYSNYSFGKNCYISGTFNGYNISVKRWTSVKEFKEFLKTGKSSKDIAAREEYIIPRNKGYKAYSMTDVLETTDKYYVVKGGKALLKRNYDVKKVNPKELGFATRSSLEVSSILQNREAVNCLIDIVEYAEEMRRIYINALNASKQGQLQKVLA